MKKFNPAKEIKSDSNSFINNAFIPLLVIGCLCLALIGVTFSYKVVSLTTNYYDIDLEIVDGEIKEYHNKIEEGTKFSDVLKADGEFAGISCSEGYLEYDQFTESISVPYVNSNVKCTVMFRDITAKYLSLDGLVPIADNDGTSYYYPGSSKNNYLKLNGLMFRIMRINGDGTLRLVLDQSDLVFNYGVNNYFSSSNLKMVLNKWFNENLKGNQYVVMGDFDVSSYSEVEISTLVNLDLTYNGYVGTLSAREATLVLLEGKDSYLGDMLLLNGALDKKVYAIKNNTVVTVGVNEDITIKPVINIVNVDLDGFGTLESPYTLKED